MTSSAFADALLARLAVVGLSLTPAEGAALERYYQLLQRWNGRMNLTALPLDDYPPATLDRLFVEAAIASRLVEDAGSRWFDLGSGGGSPAIPLRIMRPGLDLTMVESRERKCAFLREVVRQLPLERTEVLCDRFESLGAAAAGSADLVTLRAVRQDDSLAQLLRCLLASRGSLLVFGWDTPGLAGFRIASQVTLPGGSQLAHLRRD